jgi:hypothetical protein
MNNSEIRFRSLLLLLTGYIDYWYFEKKSRFFKKDNPACVRVFVCVCACVESTSCVYVSQDDMHS